MTARAKLIPPASPTHKLVKSTNDRREVKPGSQVLTYQTFKVWVILHCSRDRVVAKRGSRVEQFYPWEFNLKIVRT
jgi:hypothetical protein